MNTKNLTILDSDAIRWQDLEDVKVLEVVG